MTFKRTTHSEFDCKLTSIGDLPPINSIFLATFANVKCFIGVGKALSEVACFHFRTFDGLSMKRSLRPRLVKSS
ncbi:hypothetical protein BDN71DRAFT_92477 [Pleurotus eryngii]|uniref:Uncharacterized protein n=1 Tax=Pleurotus eryngii TaxID=5323 RepID=A0A9P5ZRZ3_PLEER|nr:hypothetical protein BDN71DRAFT_92477 [Pleurotus eryngii]